MKAELRKAVVESFYADPHVAARMLGKCRQSDGLFTVPDELGDAIISHLSRTADATDEPLVGDDGKLTRLPSGLSEIGTPDAEYIAREIEQIKRMLREAEKGPGRTMAQQPHDHDYLDPPVSARAAQGIEASGQDAKRLDAQHESPVAESDAPGGVQS